MEPVQNNEGRTAFADLTNTIDGVGQTTSSSQAQVDERVQRKREREKARLASMTQEERDEKNKKRRAKYHLRKAEIALAAGSRGPKHSVFLFRNSVLTFSEFRSKCIYIEIEVVWGILEKNYLVNKKVCKQRKFFRVYE